MMTQTHRFKISCRFLVEKSVVKGGSNVHSLLYVETEAVPNEIFAFLADEALLGIGEVDNAGLEHDSLVQNPHLTHLVTERLLSEDHLVVDDAYRPDVDFRGNERFLIVYEALGRKVPVCTNALGSQLNVLLLGYFAEAKICNFDFPLVEEDVLRLQIVVDDLVWELMQVANGTHHLSDDQLGLFLRDFLVLLEVVREIRAFAELQDSAEGSGIDFNCVIQLHYVGMTQQFVDTVLPLRMLHVVFLSSGIPFGIEFVHFNSNISELFAVKAFIHFAETALAQKAQQLVFSNAWPSSVTFQLPISRVLLLVEQPILFDMQCFFLLQSFQYFLTVAFLSTQELRLTGESHFPLFRFLSVLSLPCLSFGSIQCLFLPLYGLQFLPGFSQLNAIYPVLFAFPI